MITIRWSRRTWTRTVNRCRTGRGARALGEHMLVCVVWAPSGVGYNVVFVFHPPPTNNFLQPISPTISPAVSPIPSLRTHRPIDATGVATAALARAPRIGEGGAGMYSRNLLNVNFKPTIVSPKQGQVGAVNKFRQKCLTAHVSPYPPA